MPPLSISLSDIAFFGNGLNRPECVLCTAKGHVYCADWRGGVTRLDPDGRRQEFLATNTDIDIRPNGIALCRDGSFLLANLGDDGGLYRLRRTGALETVLTAVEGFRLPPANFVLIDACDRIWLTVSTRHTPRALGYRPDVADGFIVLQDQKGTRIVADGLGYTNEVQVDATGQWLYVNETFGRRLSRFRISANGTLGIRETVAEFGPGTYPDGLTFDAEGGIWITSIVSNRVIRISLDGFQHVVLEDSDPEHVATAEKAFQGGTMDRSHLDNIKSRRLRNISSLAFGGSDLKTVYLGCLLGDSLATFRSPVAGRPPVHWFFDG
ncbi:MAG: SMP-30/gluconolactonase/LRE family protein [Desulfobacterales bacterium]